jgi:hypothetical protein
VEISGRTDLYTHFKPILLITGLGSQKSEIVFVQNKVFAEISTADSFPEKLFLIVREYSIVMTMTDAIVGCRAPVDRPVAAL